MSEDPARGSPVRRLSQLFDPLARLTEYTQPVCSSVPGSPRLLPRRARIPPVAGPQPPPRPHAALDSLDQECLLAWNQELTPGHVNWQERCLELQLELHRSRTQATRVRDMLRDKVGGFLIVISGNDNF